MCSITVSVKTGADVFLITAEISWSAQGWVFAIPSKAVALAQVEH
jgi:hypothetical protein